MELPFNVDQFLKIFQEYNLAIWPVQLIAYTLGIIAVFLVIYRNKYTDKAITSVLALFWLWTGMIYHIGFFSSINQAAYLFGSLFVVQGVLFLYAGLLKDFIHFDIRWDMYGIWGLLLMIYALLIYPIIGMYFGHGYPNAPMFGVAPCPMTIFTFGLLLWTKGTVPLWVLIIPFLWSLIGFTAAFKLGIVEDTGLLGSGIIATSLLLYRKLQLTNNHQRSLPG